MPDLRLDNEQHRAWLGDRELIRVTTALTEGLSIDTRWFTVESQVRGTWLHRAHARLCRGEAVGPVPAEYAPYWDGLLETRHALGMDVVAVEEPVYDEAHGYAGEFDVVCRFRSTPDGWLELIDLKSGGLPVTVGPQTMAYKRPLMKAYPTTQLRRSALVLPGDGRAGKLVPLNYDARTGRFDYLKDRHDEHVFLSALCVAQWKRAHR